MPHLSSTAEKIADTALHLTESADKNSESVQILYGSRSPDLMRQETLSDLLEATATLYPRQIALIFDSKSGRQQLTYQELNRQADVAAAGLIQQGVGPGQIIGLCMPRGIDALIMQAAIAKAGAAWLPFDAQTPVERISVCLEDAQAGGIILSHAQFSGLSESSCVPVPIWTEQQLLHDSTANLAELLVNRKKALPSDPAYVIYTSGSTGKPKGIAISQGSICHFLRSENSLLNICMTDRVYQGFSLAFDMSFEEIWISYLVGATLWIAPADVALDPEALPRALEQNNVTVLHAVPTLLALFSQEVASLRLINLGGEMCPEALVQRWARPGRQMFNTYGPTETTVSASLAELHPDLAVTIGKPLPNYGMLILEQDSEQASAQKSPDDPAFLPSALRLAARGSIGELCIFGPGVASGYLARAELSAEKFIANPWARAGFQEQRLYRTGDLACISEQGQIQCLGRTDDQVKIRGFRVELGEIEAVLARQPGVATVAVILQQDSGIDYLTAYLVAEAGIELQHSQLRSALIAVLPPYMVPGRFELLNQMPRLTSGKIDRKTLKSRMIASQTMRADSASSDLAVTPAEQHLFTTLQKLFPGQPIRREMDFFNDLGGHSLLAARLASGLRADPEYTYFKISEIYQHRNLGNIASALEQARENFIAQRSNAEQQEAWTTPSDLKRWMCGAAQAFAIPWLVAMHMLQWLAPFFAYHFFTGDPEDSIYKAIALSAGVFLLLTLMQFFIAFAGKWLIAGRLKAGNYPLWGLTYYRWWLSDRLLEAAPVYMLSGSSLYPWWLRSLGAKIGSDVCIGSISIRAPDLLQIDHQVSIGNACYFENARIERGQLKLGSVNLGKESCVGSYCVLEGNVILEDFAHLEGQSALSDGEKIPASRIWGGSPATDRGSFHPDIKNPRPVVSGLRLWLESIYFILGSLFIAALFFLPVFPSFITIDLIDNAELYPWLQSESIAFQLTKYFLFAFPATALLIIFTALISASIRWLVLSKLSPGTYAVHSNTYCAKWLVNQIQESSLNVLHGIYATVFAPFWYRLLGAKVGKGAEISTALGVVPDMLTLGDETFIADAVLLGDEHIDGGWMIIQPTVISRRSFVGNGAYIPDGTVLPENVLIGVHSSVPKAELMKAGDTWLGSPAIHLPAREETHGFPEELTFHPSWLRRLGRTLVETLRIIAPHALVTAVGYTIVLDLMPMASEDRWAEVIYYLAISGLLYGFGCFAFVLILKWLVIFRYTKSSKPMWTKFVWFSEAITNLYEGIAVPNFLRYLRGTPWLPLALNLMGCKIGKGVYLDTTDLTEFDCITIGAYSEINALACPQTHLFEDRVMKIDHVNIGERVYMGPRSFVLYGAVVGDGAKLGALTLVMKGEYIPPNSSWRGCPASIAR